MGLKEDILFLEIVYILFWGSSEAAMGRGAQRPVGHGNEPRKTGERSARTRTRGQNPLVFKYLMTTASFFLLFFFSFMNAIHPGCTVLCSQIHSP